MTSINYRGYEIRWSDNADEWVCYDAGKGISGQSLLKVKAAIDRLNLADRKAAATNCFEVNEHSATKTESIVVQYVERREHRAYGKEPAYTEHRVAVVARRGGNERASRQETRLRALMPETPEAAEAWELFTRRHAIAKSAEEIARIAWKAIPRLEIPDIQKLVDLYEAEKDASRED